MSKFTFDANIFSDLYKEVYGVRPGRGHEFYHASNNRAQEIWDRLCDEHEFAMEQYYRWQQEALADFERDIALHMEHGAPSRVDAILWMFDRWCDDERMGAANTDDQLSNSLTEFFYCMDLGFADVQNYLKEVQG